MLYLRVYGEHAECDDFMQCFLLEYLEAEGCLQDLPPLADCLLGRRVDEVLAQALSALPGSRYLRHDNGGGDLDE